jgi:hypothetical protein
MKKALACTMLLGVVWSLPAAADTPLQFKGGIGVHPVSNVTGCPATGPCLTDPTDTNPPAPLPPAGPTVVLNIVRGVPPPGQIWVINDLVATVHSDGSITVNGKGLILAGGNNAGRPPPGASVFATLLCDNATPSTTQFNTSSVGVLLSPTGDFQINDTLKNGATTLPPIPCTNPMLLIRSTAGAMPWFAVGIYSPNGS